MKRLINLEVKNVLKSTMGNNSLKNVHIANTIVNFVVLAVLVKYVFMDNILSQLSVISQLIILTSVIGMLIFLNLVIWIASVSIYQKERYIKNVIEYGYYEE